MKATTIIALRRLRQFLICAAILALGSRAGAGADFEGAFPPPYHPDNIHQTSKRLSNVVRRVAVLPLASASSRDLPEGCEALGSILVEELIKSKRFEVVSVDPQTLKRATSQTEWKGEEMLPANLLAWLTNKYACDAVLIPQLTAFRGYPPLAVGWRFKLVDINTGAILWATDEVFDAGQPNVIAAAKRFDRDKGGAKTSNDGWALFHCPRRFGRYSAAALLELLPER